MIDKIATLKVRFVFGNKKHQGLAARYRGMINFTPVGGKPHLR
jgi:hypothetical protein